MVFQNAPKDAALNRKKLFFIDGLGALLSAFILGLVFTRYQSLIGMPIEKLHFLAGLACVFMLYDIWCYFKKPNNSRNYLRAIAIANFIYAIISIGLVIQFYDQLTLIGLSYFILEITILFILASYEFNT